MIGAGTSRMKNHGQVNVRVRLRRKRDQRCIVMRVDRCSTYYLRGQTRPRALANSGVITEQRGLVFAEGVFWPLARHSTLPVTL
jgi:hypothetical protein